MDQSVSPRALSKAQVWKCFISDRTFVKVQLSVLDFSDAKTHERAYSTPKLQMFPRGQNLPRPNSICYKSPCGSTTGCECTAETRRTFHWSLLNHFSCWGYASKHHKLLFTWQKTYRVKSRKSPSIKWDTRFQHPPCYLWGIQRFPPSLLPHWAWAAAKLSWTCPTTKELSYSKQNLSQIKSLCPTPPLTSYSLAIRVNCKHIIPTAWLIEKNSCYVGAWFSHLAYSQGSAINYDYIWKLCKQLKHPECLHGDMLFLSVIWNSQDIKSRKELSF